MTCWTPEDAIALLSFQSFELVKLTDLLHDFSSLLTLGIGFNALLHAVERHIDLGATWILGMNHGETVTSWFKAQCHDGILHVKHLNRDARLVKTEQLNVVVECLLGFGVSCDLDSEIISIALPNHATLGNVKKILLSELLAAWDINEIDVSWGILEFWSLLLQAGRRVSSVFKMVELTCRKRSRHRDTEKT